MCPPSISCPGRPAGKEDEQQMRMNSGELHFGAETANHCRSSCSPICHPEHAASIPSTAAEEVEPAFRKSVVLVYAGDAAWVLLAELGPSLARRLPAQGHPTYPP